MKEWLPKKLCSLLPSSIFQCTRTNPCLETLCHMLYRGVSECVRRILVSSQIKVCYKPYQNLRTLLSRSKDQVPDLQRSGVVYKIPCAVCSKVYIGQTGRRLCQRISEHNRAVKSANFNSSTLAEHAWSAGHPVDWDNVSATVQTTTQGLYKKPS